MIRRYALVVLAMTLVCTLAFDADAKKRRRPRKKAPRASAPAAPARIVAPRYTIERMPDGTTLIHIPKKGDRVSVRVGVRAGSLHDPAEKAGVAWLLSRLVFDGSYDVPAGELPTLVRSLGGSLDVDVGATWTMFSLDAPSGAFKELFEKQLLLLTNPMLQFADLDRARQAATHASENGVDALRFAIDELAFPAENQGRRIAGTAATRSAIKLPDLLEFYARYYAPSNTIVVVTGDVPIGDARAVLERAVLWPPVPEPDYELIGGDPNVPAEARSFASYSASALAYHLGPIDRADCDAIARVVEVRAMTALRWYDPVATEVRVRCLDARGQPFLAAFAAGKNDAGGQLPTLLARAVERSAARPISKEERTVVLARKASELLVLRTDPARLASAVCRRALDAPEGLREHIDAFWRAPDLRGRKLTDVMRTSLVPERRVSVTFSPFEG